MKLFFFIIYSICISYIGYHHEVWRDEVDPWLFARDTNFSDIIVYTSNTGHPSLWILILIPFAKLGFASYSITIIHILIAIGSAFLILFHSTFHFFIRVLILFSYFFLFEYSIIARNYALGIFFLFSIATFYSKRFSNPKLFGFLILLLANTSLFSCILAFCIGVIFTIEAFEKKMFNRNLLIGLGIALFGGILVILQVLPNAETQLNAPRSLKIFNDLGLPISIIQSFSPGATEWNYRISMGFIILFFSGILFYRNKKVFLYYILSLSILFFFYTFVFISGHRHSGFVLQTFIFSLWIFLYTENNSENTKLNLMSSIIQIGFGISLFFSCLFAFKEIKKDIRYSFSNAKEMGEFIKKAGLDSEQYSFSALSADKGKTILFYLNRQKKFYYPGIEAEGSNMWWDKKMGIGELVSVEEGLERSRVRFATQNDFFYITHKPFAKLDSSIQLKYQTSLKNEFIKDEEFFLYQVFKK